MNLKVLLAAVIVFAFCACSTNNVREPEQIGKQVFEILKNISSSSKDDYISNFLSIEEIRELGKNEDVVKDADTRNEMTSMLKEKWISKIEKDYNRIKEKGGKSGIIWNEIQYLDFVYELKDEDGIKGCEGELYFKFSDKSFKIEIASIFNGTEYRLFEIEDLGQYNVNTEVDSVISYKPTIEETTSGTFIDSRDGNEYNWVQIGDQVWMAENLKYLPSVVGPGTESETTPHYYVYGYDGTNVADAKATDTYATYGVLYNWTAALTACPTGWHLPTDAEWTTLITFLGGDNVAGGKLRETGTTHWHIPNTGATNETGFTALPGGYRSTNGSFNSIGSFYGIGYCGYWWSATENYATNAWLRNMDYDNSIVTRGYSIKAPGRSVRCVRD